MRTIYKKIAAPCIIVALVFLGTSWYVHESEADMAAEIKLLIAEQEVTLSSIAELTDRDGADSVVSNIIKDCAPAERERFDSLLARLSTLNAMELVEVDRLFASCGNYYAERKSAMVARFQREYEVYEAYVDLLSHINSKAALIEYPRETWGELVSLETMRSKLASELVQIQLQIITELRAGAGVSSDAIQVQITQANEVKESLSFTGVQIDRLRENVLRL